MTTRLATQIGNDCHKMIEVVSERLHRTNEIRAAIEHNMSNMEQYHVVTYNTRRKDNSNYKVERGQLWKQIQEIQEIHVVLQKIIRELIPTYNTLLKFASSLRNTCMLMNEGGMRVKHKEMIDMYTSAEKMYEKMNHIFYQQFKPALIKTWDDHSVKNIKNHTKVPTPSRVRFRNGNNNVRIIPSRNELKQMELNEKMENNEFFRMAASNAFSGGRRTLRKKRTRRSRA